MIIDLAQQPAGTVIDAQVCIVGAGAAGVTLALAFAAQGVDCAVLESGGAKPDAAVQSLSEVDEVGAPLFRPLPSRDFGGATAQWGGYCAPLNTLDFERRAWVPRSGWPIAPDDLRPYYPQAQRLCGLGDFVYRPDDVPGAPRHYRAFDASRLTTRLFEFSDPPLNFAEAYRDELARAASVRICLNANVIRLETNAAATRVTAAVIRSPGGWQGQARARHFVIACGGIENARLLLLSNRVQAAGLGNGHDNVGRYFMQHPHIDDAAIAIVDSGRLTSLVRKFDANGRRLQVSIGPSRQVQADRRILNCSATVHTVPAPGSGDAALRDLQRDLKRRRWPTEPGPKLRAIARDIRPVARRMLHGPEVGALYLRSEQLPDPDSRVSLSPERDCVGQPLARLDWRLGELDRRTLRISALLIGRELGRTGFGTVRLPLWLVEEDGDWPHPVWAGSHHMGTTRMSSNERDGVVNADCRLHQVRNLYVAGSSVFPTGGYANPTLTLVALAARLADHIGRALRHAGEGGHA